MAFDTATRNRLARFVADARELIKEEFKQQFQSLYGIAEDGAVASLEQLRHLDEEGHAIAERLRHRIDYLVRSHPEERDGKAMAVDRLARELAFTVLNRLAAVRMAEQRGLIQQSVGQGYASKGFKLYETVAYAGLGDTYHRYRTYLYCLFDELAVDLGALFDRRSPTGLLFPREAALVQLLALINAADLEQLWGEDETIGWIYQYYNDPDERKKMRKESATPRNSRELAVRNQFFTPRYVVEFLTDNTLGRIWYEMTQGRTALADRCRYLVRMSHEVFLEAGQQAPEQAIDPDLKLEERLKLPAHIPHRAIKDPRDMRFLDPACGSMHFGLYATDLLEVIYEEAWHMNVGTLQQDYPTVEALRREVPKLIIERNIHGIDIDPRAAQIANLALWLRAQRSWHEQGVPAAERPRIVRSHVVCAEAMPGDHDQLVAFVEESFPEAERNIFRYLLEQVVGEMQLAGEAGYLLPIEQQIKGLVEKTAELVRKARTDPKLFAVAEMQAGYKAGGKDATLATAAETLAEAWEKQPSNFFETLEARIYAALATYANAAADSSTQRRLFAEDAARGFALIDLCRQQYDVVVMNPPFGTATTAVFEELKRWQPDTYTELYASFVNRGVELLCPGGKVGVISSRAFLTISRLDAFRKDRLMGRIDVLLDLGGDVMDAAFVESCAYVIASNQSDGSLYVIDARRLETRENLPLVLSGIQSPHVPQYMCPWSRLRLIPGGKLLYEIDDALFGLLLEKDVFEPAHGTVRQGMGTFDDFRFVRLFWEVPSAEIGFQRTWEPLAKGGPFATYYSDIHLVLNWGKDGAELCEVNIQHNGQTAQVRQASDWWRKGGCTYSKRSARGFSARALPSNCIITGKGPAVISLSEVSNHYILGWLNSRLVVGLIQSQANAFEFNTGILKNLPWREPSSEQEQEVASLALRCALDSRTQRSLSETDPYFRFSPVQDSIATGFEHSQGHLMGLEQAIFSNHQRITSTIDAIYRVDSSLLVATGEELTVEASESDDEDELESLNLQSFTARHISWIVGSVFGRWDIRHSLSDEWTRELPDPFSALPICPPGMLQSEQGLPVEPKDVPGNYPLRISWPGILVDDEGHPEDIVARVREAIAVMWGERAEAIEQEACEMLGVASLRDYFQKPALFFAEHLKRHSKSRRQAPLYWPIGIAKGRYTLWLYYHRLTDQTLHSVLADFVAPKAKAVELELRSLKESNAPRSRIEPLEDLAKELQELTAELERIAALPWKPNLNDGVLITASPLWKLFRLGPWQKNLKACWQKLEKGDYDWAHLAYSIWPERVEGVCKRDRSIAIAHDLEHLCEVEAPKKKEKKARKKKG